MNEKNEKDKKLSFNLFCLRGIESSAVSQMALKEHISQEVVDIYFDHKEEAVNEYIENSLEKALLYIKKNINRYKSNKKKILFIVLVLSFFKYKDKEFSYIFLEFFKQSFSQITIKKEESKYYKKYEELLAFYIKEGEKKKEFKNCNSEEVAFSIISTILGNLLLAQPNRFILSGVFSTLNAIKYSN